jgi:hypothetical protein
MQCFQVCFSFSLFFFVLEILAFFLLAKEALIPGSIYDRTTTINDKRQLYANNFTSTFRNHDPLSYIDTGTMNGMSQPLNGYNLPMPHQMMMPSMPMAYMDGPSSFNTMINGDLNKEIFIY